MFKSLFLRTTIAALTFGSLSVSANQTIDLFSDNQAKIEVAGGTGGPGVFSSALGADILGGERDIIITAGSGVEASAVVTNNQLLIASGGGYAGSDQFSVEVQWDGIDGSSTLDTTGLAPAADFSTLNGFTADINKSDGSGSFDVSIYDTNGQSAVLNLNFVAVAATSPKSFSIPFALFTGVNAALDLSSIGAITLKLTAEGDTDIRVAGIQAVPAPSSLAILGLGLLGFAGLARRKA